MLAKEEDKLRRKQIQSNVYKGKFRYLLLQEMVEKEAKQR